MGELEKAVEILTCGFCSHSISHSPINLHSRYNSIDTLTDKDLYDKKISISFKQDVLSENKDVVDLVFRMNFKCLMTIFNIAFICPVGIITSWKSKRLFHPKGLPKLGVASLSTKFNP